MQLQVLFEDNHLIAINKPAGYLVQGDDTGDKPLSEHVKDYIKLRYQKPGAVYLGVIHRLDRPVSGVLVFARTSKALTRMNALFQERQVEKTYLAITSVQPDPLEGRLVNFLDKDPTRNKVSVLPGISRRHPQAREAELTYELLGRVGHQCLLKVNPITGRPHQIRAQLAHIGCPIRGDVKYGYPQANEDACIHLHCRKLRFVHPVTQQPLTIYADPPQNDAVWRLFSGMFRR